MKELTERDKQIIIDSIPSSSLVCFCPMLQGRGSTLIDRSVEGNGGTISGATWARLPSGVNVLNFNGVNQYVTFGSPASIWNKATGGIEVWVRSTAGGARSVVLYGVQNNDLLMRENGTCFLRLGAAMQWSMSTDALVAGAMTQYIVTQDGVAAKLYVNGELKVTEDVGADITAWLQVLGERTLYLGYVDGGAGYFYGDIAMFIVHDEAPSLADISQRYNRLHPIIRT